MASDFSSGCTETIDVLEEKEEGEISLEDVSSSEEGHLNYGYNSRNIELCPGCSSSLHCASWCNVAARSNRSKAFQKKDAVHGKENRRYIKGIEHPGGKHASSTLQEKNDDLIPISSDSDMDLVGLTDSTFRAKSSKVKKKRKKRKPRSPSIQVEVVSSVSNEIFENITVIKRNPAASKENRLLKTHHKEKSPIQKTRSFPRRRRSPLNREKPPVGKTRSSAAHTKSIETKKSPRRAKSPRKSIHKPVVNPLHKKVRKHSPTPKFAPSPASDVTHLLKKVRQLEMVGTTENGIFSNKSKEHGSSLKDKLNNILKLRSENSGSATNGTKEKKNITDNNRKEDGEEEEDEDLNILRQKALETKQSRTNKSQDSLNAESDIKVSSTNEDDDDEDLKLRWIALRSAVLKKHRNRIQRGLKSAKRKKSLPPRTESPFSDSFINNLSIAEQDEESPSVSPQTSPALKDCMSLEDMELDSDVERNMDSDNAPYSPTDEVNTVLISEVEQLGIDATDVSLININRQCPNRHSSPLATTEREVTPPVGNFYCNSRYSNANFNSDFRFPRSQSTIILDSPYKDTLGRTLNEEKPYSPTDTPVYDSDLSETLLSQNVFSNNNSMELSKFVNNLGLNNNTSHSCTRHSKESSEIDQAMSISSNLNLTSSSAETSSISNNIMITIDDLPETDLDGSPLVPMEKDSNTHYHIPEHLSHQMIQPSYEPLYLKNLPDITDDPNNIPTLITKSSVPVPILKVYKQLQQKSKEPPPYLRRQELQAESMFRGASTQPASMDLESINSAVNLIPIKYDSLAKKQVALKSVAFDQFRENSTPDKIENKLNIQRSNETAFINIHEESTNKKKRRIRKARKRNSKRKRKQLAEINKSMEEEKSTQQMTNYVDQAYEKPEKRLKTIQTESVNNEEIVLSKNADIASKSKDTGIEKTNEEQNFNENLVNQKDQLLSDPSDNNSTVVKNSSEAVKSSVNEKLINEKLSPSKYNVKDVDAIVEEQKDLKLIEETRRNSIDEDEEALRALLLASMAKRTKSVETKTASKSLTMVPEPSKTVTTSNVSSCKTSQDILQTNKTNSLPAAPKTNTKASESITHNLSASAAPVTKPPSAKIPVNNTETVNLVLGKRKASSVIIAGSPRKVIKRTVIPASTKVVNNAKRYQNSLIQKRLNLQKTNTVFNAKKIIANRSLRVLNRNQSTRSISPNVSKCSEGVRFIINLNSDSESDSESERQKAKVAVARNSSVEKGPPLTIPTTEFERSVEQFLRDVRKKQEATSVSKPSNSSLANKQPLPPPKTTSKREKSATLPATPLAVRHLPASQQEEYHRLKQQILERELKLKRTGCSQQTVNNNTVTLSGPLSPAGPTTCTKQKLVSTAVTNNLSKALSTNTKSPPLNSLSTPASLASSSLASQAKLNLSIQVRNDRVSPTKTSTTSTSRNSLIIQSSTQKNLDEPPKKTGPLLKILTSEQVNMKWLQIHVKQKEEGRKVVVRGTNSPQKENNISSSRKGSELKQNLSQKEIVKMQISGDNVKESLITSKLVDLDGSLSNVNRSKEVNKTHNSEASTIVPSNSKTTVSDGGSKINKTIESSALTVVLSQSDGTSLSENNTTINSTGTMINALQRKVPVISEKTVGKQISKVTPEGTSIKPSTTSTALKAANTSKGLTGAKALAVRKEHPALIAQTVEKTLMVSKKPSVSLASSVSKAVETILDSSTVNMPIIQAVVTPSTLSKSIEPIKDKSTSSVSTEAEITEENGKKKSVSQKPAKSVNNEKLTEIKDDVQVEMMKILKLGEEEKRKKLLETEQELVAKRYVVLDDLVEVSRSLRQWESEKDLQESLTVEVKKLREQLLATEARLQEQKERVTTMGSKVAIVHEKMNVGRKQCYRLAKICTGLGNRLVGKKYKVPEAGVQLVNKRLKEVAQTTSQLCKKSNDKKKRNSESSEKYDKEESIETDLSTSDKLTDPVERHNSCESSTSSSRTVSLIDDDQSEVESSQEATAEKDDLIETPLVEKNLKEKEEKEREQKNENSTHLIKKTNTVVTNRITNPLSGKTQTQETPETQSNGADKTSNKQSGRPYESILSHLKIPRSTRPDGILCPYQLMGSCHDGECQFIHHPTSH